MSHVPLESVQRFVEVLFDCPHCEIKPLGMGATSTAWAFSCGSNQYVLRAVYHTTNRPITYRSEFLILQTLREQRCPVPEPLYTSFDQDISLDERVSAWAISRTVAGTAILKSQLTPAVAAQLGAFLSVLHGLPHADFGRPDENSTTLKGQQTTHVEGIRARWCWAQMWPFDNTLLSDHPITSRMPGLVNSLRGIETKLWEIITEPRTALIHSDLYGEHIFTDEDQLTGVIDFGAAFIATSGWDFAVLAYYHGWEALENILQGYTQSEIEREHLRSQSHYLAVAVGLYKLEKAVRTGGTVTKQQQIIGFIAKTLALL